MNKAYCEIRTEEFVKWGKIRVTISDKNICTISFTTDKRNPFLTYTRKTALEKSLNRFTPDNAKIHFLADSVDIDLTKEKPLIRDILRELADLTEKAQSYQYQAGAGI